VRKIKDYIFFIIMALFVYGCNSHPRRTEAWADAALVAKQQAVIDRQREYIGDLERIIHAGSENLRNAEERLGSLDQGTFEFKDWLQRVNEFVRAVIAEQRRLEQVQFTDSGANAAER